MQRGPRRRRRGRKPASVAEVAVRGGTKLVQVRGTLEQVLAAPDLEGCYVKVLLDEPARAGLNEEVREAIPGSVDVIIAEPRIDHPETASNVWVVRRRPFSRPISRRKASTTPA